MPRLLVTGASGLLGLNLALEAAEEHTVIGVTHSRALAQPPFETIQADLLAEDAIERLLDATEPEWIVHCAALANLDACEQDPMLARRLNAEVPGQLAAAAVKRGARLLHISTDAVFDGQQGEYAEGDETQPLSVYARTKLAGEGAVLANDAEALVLRSVFFGWSLSGQRSLAEHFYKRLAAGESMPGHTDRIFSPLLVNHLARILLDMLAQGLQGLYHATSADAISKYEFGLALAQRFGLNGSLIQPIKAADAGLRAARALKLNLRSDKLAADLGRPMPSVEAGLDGFYQLYQAGYPRRLRALVATPAKES